MIYQQPGQPGAVINFKDRYENFIGGEWVAPVKGRYMDNVSPVNGQVFCQVPQSDDQDVDLAVKAADKAFATWSKTSAAERSKEIRRASCRERV